MRCLCCVGEAKERRKRKAADRAEAHVTYAATTLFVVFVVVVVVVVVVAAGLVSGEMGLEYITLRADLDPHVALCLADLRFFDGERVTHR